ncbi:MAG: hypothetical protein JW963_26605, partial [Anaerolineales bacterium]|nr:hypothetical protein [Anaerolineales bacterium]
MRYKTMTHENLVPFGRYVRLYTLHQVEGPVELLMLRIQIETLHYSFMPLLTDGVSCHEIDAAYAADPRTGAALVRQAVLPRLQTLLDTREPFHELGEGSAARWARYAAACGLPAQPRRIPVIHAPSVIPRLP